MSSEITRMTDLQRTILHHLMEGWQTMDQGKTAGIVRLDELADRLGVQREDLREELALLEAFGYVDNVHSMGMDQTEVYKRIGSTTDHAYDPDNPTYFITENGKRLVIADDVGDDSSAASPA